MDFLAGVKLAIDGVLPLERGPDKDLVPVKYRFIPESKDVAFNLEDKELVDDNLVLMVLAELRFGRLLALGLGAVWVCIGLREIRSVRLGTALIGGRMRGIRNLGILAPNLLRPNGILNIGCAGPTASDKTRIRMTMALFMLSRCRLSCYFLDDLKVNDT